MNCPHCGTVNRKSAQSCQGCGEPLAMPTLESTGAVPENANQTSSPTILFSQPSADATTGSGEGSEIVSLLLGSEFGSRYTILGVIGEGGMGRVYRAYDKELDREVALKLLKPAISTRENALERFKREIKLASKITHTNVLRIHDLGDVDGVKYISMHYVEGEDLHRLIKREGALPVDRVRYITEQLCLALEAAHKESVIHRDLKPHNILIDKDDHIYVTDFGIARSVEATPDVASMTGTGMMLGTPGYMSPEQIKGEKSDRRSDLYSLGAIIHEMLTGRQVFADAWNYESLMRRVHQRPTNPQTLDPALPDYLAGIVVKCLEPNPALRYQSATEVLVDLRGQRVRKSIRHAVRRAAGLPSLLALAILIAAGLLAWWLVRPETGSRPDASATPARVLAILPMENGTGDASLDWMSRGLAQMLSMGLAESKVIRPVSPDRLYQVMRDLKLLDQQRYDPIMLKQIAEFSSAPMLLTGSFFKDQDRFRVVAQLHDLQTDYDLPITVEGGRDLPDLVEILAQKLIEQLRISKSLAATGPRKALREVTTSSEEALRLYYQALSLLHQGNTLEAVGLLENAVKADPRFAMAYASLAISYHKLGYADRAERYARQALQLSENLTSHELHHVAATEALVSNAHQASIDEYKKLIEAFPQEPDAYFDLASVYETTGAWDLALEHYRKALELDPKYTDALIAVGRVLLRKGNAQEALKPLGDALTLNIGLNNQQGRADGLHAIGVAHKLLRNYDAALRYYRESLEIKRQIGDQRGVAATLSEIGAVYQSTGRHAEARQNYQAALELSQQIGDVSGRGKYMNNIGALSEELGRYDEALGYYRKALSIASERGAKSEIANRLNNIGYIYFLKGQYQDAASSYNRALDSVRSTPDRRGIGSILAALGDLASHQGDYDEALKQQFEALKIWRELHDSEQVAYTAIGIGGIFEFQGRLVAALKSREEALATFTKLQDQYGLAAALNILGHTYSLLGAYDRAIEQLQKAERMANEMKNGELQIEVLVHQGELKRLKGEFEDSRRLLSRAVEAAKQPNARITAQIQLGLVRLESLDASGALIIFKQALAQAEEVGIKPLAVDARAGLAQAYLQQRSFSAAERQLVEASGLADRLGLVSSLMWCRHLGALLARAQGRAEQAIHLYGQALDLIGRLSRETIGTPYAQSFLQRHDLRLLLQGARAFFISQGKERALEPYMQLFT